MFEFNLNSEVFIRLTHVGRAILKTNHIELYSMLHMKHSIPEFKLPDENNEGWSKWQMWEVMQSFGAHVSLGFQIPFETTIRLAKKDLKDIQKAKERENNPDLDCTPFESPAFQRGEAYGVDATIQEIMDILDGKDNGNGVCGYEPLETLRRRLLKAKKLAGEKERALDEAMINIGKLANHIGFAKASQIMSEPSPTRMNVKI